VSDCFIVDCGSDGIYIVENRYIGIERKKKKKKKGLNLLLQLKGHRVFPLLLLSGTDAPRTVHALSLSALATLLKAAPRALEALWALHSGGDGQAQRLSDASDVTITPEQLATARVAISTLARVGRRESYERSLEVGRQRA
jgi:hypothetical protein